MEFLFRKLIVWQKAMEFTRLVYDVVKRFPNDERYALSDQIRRAAVSVPSNIAEGNGRATNRDYAHFLSVARGSLYEVMTQLEIAHAQGYVEDFREIETIASETGRILTSLIRKHGSLEIKD